MSIQPLVDDVDETILTSNRKITHHKTVRSPGVKSHLSPSTVSF